MSNNEDIILGTGPMDQLAIDIVAPYGKFVAAPDPSEETILGLIDNAISLVVRGGGTATAAMFERGKKLKVIGRSGAGYDMVDIEAANRHKVPIVFTPGQSTRAVAEASFAFMIALVKELPYWDQQMKAGNWNSRFDKKAGDLDEQTLGIVGFGAIGQMMATLAGPFNMTIIAFDPYGNPERAKELGVELVDLDTLLKRSKFISIHAPLNDETRGLINGQSLKLVQPGSYIINLARGGLIENLDILYDALQDGTLAGVGLDVFEPEPPEVNHPIFKLPNCLTAPHALGMTHQAMARIFRTMAEGMADVFEGRRPKYVLNPEVLD